MYVLMYAMVNTFDNVYPNINQFYMASLMATAMVLIGDWHHYTRHDDASKANRDIDKHYSNDVFVQEMWRIPALKLLALYYLIPEPYRLLLE